MGEWNDYPKRKQLPKAFVVSHPGIWNAKSTSKGNENTLESLEAAYPSVLIWQRH